MPKFPSQLTAINERRAVWKVSAPAIRYQVIEGGPYITRMEDYLFSIHLAQHAKYHDEEMRLVEILNYSVRRFAFSDLVETANR